MHILRVPAFAILIAITCDRPAFAQVANTPLPRVEGILLGEDRAPIAKKKVCLATFTKSSEVVRLPNGQQGTRTAVSVEVLMDRTGAILNPCGTTDSAGAFSIDIPAGSPIRPGQEVAVAFIGKDFLDKDTPFALYRVDDSPITITLSLNTIKLGELVTKAPK